MSLFNSDRGEVDGLLLGITSAASQFDMHLSVTLVVPGAVVAGKVVSPTRWLAAQAELFGTLAHGDAIASVFTTLRDEHSADAAISEAIESETPGQSASNFVYLLDGHILGTPIGPKSLPQHFKVRLDAVSAWTFGEPTR